MTTTGALDLLDWRRRTAALYAQVRARRDADPRGAHAHWIAERDALFAQHPQSPLDADGRAAFRGLPHFAYDPSLAFTAPVLDAPPERLAIAGSNGSEVVFARIGRVDLPIGSLDVFWLDAYGGGIFLPFRDATAGHATYGAGRYLLDTVKGADLGAAADGGLVLDFNFSYHPSCAHAPAWNCPLAPPGNRIGAEVAAGERLTYD